MRALRWLNEHLEEYLLVIFCALIIAIVFYQVIMRYVFAASPSWSEELARLFFVWLVFIGISYGVKRQSHILVDAILVLLRQRGKIIVNIISHVFFLCFALVIVYYGFHVVLKTLARGQLTSGLGVPMAVFFTAAPVGMALTSFRIIQHIWKQANYLRTP